MFHTKKRRNEGAFGAIAPFASSFLRVKFFSCGVEVSLGGRVKPGHDDLYVR
jgi:hypothetical protein